MRTTGCWMRRVSAAGVAALGPLLAQGQTLQARSSVMPVYSTALVGVVRDTAGRPIPGVEMRLTGKTTILARTNDDGGFRVASMEVGQTAISLRRLGYAPTVVEVRLRPGQIDSLVISLQTLATNLPGVFVEDEYMTRSKRILAGFWHRKQNGFGNFLTRDEIENRNTSDFTELVRMMPGARVMSRDGRKVIRFNRSIGTRDCPPQFFVDGMRIESGQPDEFTPEDVEAIEVYSGISIIPVEFAPRPHTYTCGAIVIWTRIP